MSGNLRPSSSSHVLHEAFFAFPLCPCVPFSPAEHHTSLGSPSAQFRARGGGDGMFASERPKSPMSMEMGGGAGPSSMLGGGGGLARAGGSGGSGLAASTPGGGMPTAALELELPRVLALPTPDALRAGVWAALHGAVLLGTARYLGTLRKAQRDLYWLYYQPFLPMLAMLWLWAAAVRLWERRRIRYDACFAPDDQRFLLRSGQLAQICNALTALVLTSGLAFTYLLAYGMPHAAAYLPPALYAALLAGLLFPGALLFRDSRLFFGMTLWRIVTPLRSVSWADFLLADILTSLAKALSDTERAVCHMMVGPTMQADVPACSDASFILPLGLAAPYAWRLVQCIRVYLDTGARPQLLNALKYSTAFPVILLSYVKYHVPHADWRAFWKPLWLASALLNSAYSFYWDVERDWEISFFSQWGQQRGAAVPSPVLRPHLFFRRPFYLYLMASNLLLRLSWTYKLSPHLRDHHLAVFCIVLAEAFRRFQWLFVRIEVELRKIQSHRPDAGQLVPLAPQQGGYAALPGHHGREDGEDDGGGPSADKGGEARRSGGGTAGHTPPSAGKQQARARDKKVQVLEFPPAAPLHAA